MSWIKDNKFLVTLTSCTLVGVALLYLVGSKEMTKYDDAKTSYDAATAEVKAYAKMPLYPKAEHRDGKQKALEDYRASLESLQTSFDRYRPKELVNVEPQDFTGHLKKVNDEVVKAFKDSGTSLPDSFFCGFESYQATLAHKNATGILNYQLENVRTLLLALAKAKPSQVVNVYRAPEDESKAKLGAPLPEESGIEYKPKESDVTRSLPLEIAFVGTERSVREFLSAINQLEDQYMVTRSIRITNVKKDPPKVSDAKFDTPTASPPISIRTHFGGESTPGSDEGALLLPSNDTNPKHNTPHKPVTGVAGKATTAAAAKPTPAVAVKPTPPPVHKPATSGRILAQVLGNEEVQVFLRLDLLQFLPAQKLP